MRNDSNTQIQIYRRQDSGGWGSLLYLQEIISTQQIENYVCMDDGQFLTRNRSLTGTRRWSLLCPGVLAIMRSTVAAVLASIHTKQQNNNKKLPFFSLKVKQFALRWILVWFQRFGIPYYLTTSMFHLSIIRDLLAWLLLFLLEIFEKTKLWRRIYFQETKPEWQ